MNLRLYVFRQMAVDSHSELKIKKRQIICRIINVFWCYLIAFVNSYFSQPFHLTASNISCKLTQFTVCNLRPKTGDSIRSLHSHDTNCHVTSANCSFLVHVQAEKEIQRSRNHRVLRCIKDKCLLIVKWTFPKFLTFYFLLWEVKPPYADLISEDNLLPATCISGVRSGAEVAPCPCNRTSALVWVYNWNCLLFVILFL
jgi:hypothetical protein